MDLLRAVVLGIVQGLTEFLPVSSSGHLILVPELFGWEDQGLAFDVGLHAGTLVALLGYFWRDWARMAFSSLDDVRRHRLSFRHYQGETRLLLLIAAGSVPAAVAGLLLNGWIEENLRQAWLVALMLIVVGGLMLVADRRSRRDRGVLDVGLADAVLIGLAQAAALIPGVSRSGATISTGLVRGLNREAAARFAFLLGTPAFFGAALLKSSDLTGDTVDTLDLAAGFVTAAVVGFAVIHFLLGFLRRWTLTAFVVYRFGLGVFILALAALGIL